MTDPESPAPACRLCGAPGPAGPGAAAMAGWASDRDARGRQTWLCPACARRHARDIEARLDAEWW